LGNTGFLTTDFTDYADFSEKNFKIFAGNPAEEHHISDFRVLDLKSICEISVISGFSPWFRIKSP
jgi:hypothetical protein